MKFESSSSVIYDNFLLFSLRSVHKITHYYSSSTNLKSQCYYSNNFSSYSHINGFYFLLTYYLIIPFTGELQLFILISRD